MADFMDLTHSTDYCTRPAVAIYLNCLPQMSLFTSFAFTSYQLNLFPVPTWLQATATSFPWSVFIAHNKQAKIKIIISSVKIKNFDDEEMYIWYFILH